MKKKKVEEPEVKTKEFSLTKMEFLEIENIELKMQKENRMFAEQFQTVIDEFCKRVGQKKENIITNPDGRILISPKRTLMFKEV